MPRTAKPLLTLVSKRDACAALGITEKTFERHFQDVFYESGRLRRTPTDGTHSLTPNPWRFDR